MRILIYIFILFFWIGTVDAQLTINGKISTVATTYVNTNGKVGSGEGLLPAVPRGRVPYAILLVRP